MSDLRSRLRAQRETMPQTEAERVALEGTATADELFEASLRNRLAVMRAHDAAATLPEELLIRLKGAVADFGALRFEWGEKLLGPFEGTVSALGPYDVPLELTEVSHGSTVLHVRPVASIQDFVDDVPVDHSAADASLRSTLDLFEAVEARQDLGRFAAAIAPALKLNRFLDENLLDLDVTWASRSGEVRRAKVSGAGRAYLREMTEPESRTETRGVGGRITELRLGGLVKVKTGVSRKAPAHDVHFDADQLLGMHFQLGQDVHFEVREVTETDGIGRILSTRLEYVRSLSAQDGLLD